MPARISTAIQISPVPGWNNALLQQEALNENELEFHG